MRTPAHVHELMFNDLLLTLYYFGSETQWHRLSFTLHGPYVSIGIKYWAAALAAKSGARGLHVLCLSFSVRRNDHYDPRMNTLIGESGYRENSVRQAELQRFFVKSRADMVEREAQSA